MSKVYKIGEEKKRPGTYHRISNIGSVPVVAALDGINAFIMKAQWGPAGKVTKVTSENMVEATYGPGKGTEAAKAIFKGGANTVYIYRAEGTGGKAGTATLGSLKITAKYVGAHPIKVKVQLKAGDSTKKQLIVIDGTTIKETYTVDAGETEASLFVAAMAKSAYVTVENEEDGAVSPAEADLEGGVNPTVVLADYAKGFAALESYRYNVLSIDTIDKNTAITMNEYVKKAMEKGKFIQAITGQLDSVEFDERLQEAKTYNNAYMVYLGNGYTNEMGETVDGVMAVSYAAGVISSTPSSQSIVHSVVSGATDVPIRLEDEQYDAAIENGMLLFSVGPDGQVWFDSQVNTLTIPAENQDDGWKKIRRTKTRNELMDRIDRTISVKVGKVNCDSDGIADVIQGGMGVIGKMADDENKLFGGTMTLDESNPTTPDSAWFVIAVDDKDSLEKMYLNYQFRFSQNS